VVEARCLVNGVSIEKAAVLGSKSANRGRRGDSSPRRK
jgi:hypothetical protein